MREKFLWNTEKTLSIRASRIRNFTIDKHAVIAWLSNSDTLKMGEFKNDEEARAYLERVHSELEELSC